MKRIISLLFFIVQFSILIAHDFHFSLEPKIGMKRGQINEFVFLKNSFYDDDKLSELNWEIKNEFFIELNQKLNIKDSSVNLNFHLGYQQKQG